MPAVGRSCRRGPGLGSGVGPRPPRKAAGIVWSPWQPSPGARERDAEPRLTPGGHRQNCRSGSQPWRNRCAGGETRSAEAVHPWGVASVPGVLCCSPPRGCSGLGGFRFLSPGVVRSNTTGSFDEIGLDLEYRPLKKKQKDRLLEAKRQPQPQATGSWENRPILPFCSGWHEGRADLGYGETEAFSQRVPPRPSIPRRIRTNCTQGPSGQSTVT